MCEKRDADRISKSPDGRPRLGRWGVADSRQCGDCDGDLVGVDSPRRRQQRPPEFERPQCGGRTRGQTRVNGDQQAEYAKIGLFHMPAPDLTSPVEVAIMDDLARRMGGRTATMNKHKRPKLKLKRVPAILFSVVREFVTSAKTKRKSKKAEKEVLPLDVALSTASLLTGEEERVQSLVQRFQLPAGSECIEECPMPVIYEALSEAPNAVISPGLQEATALPFYFGNINRHEAVHILEGQQHGTFLLRDSSHPEHRFAVSFRYNDATVHARICFSRGLYAFRLDSKRFCSPSLAAFIANYKRNKRETYDEPSLLHPFCRKDPFSLKFLSLAAVVSVCTSHNLPTFRLPDQLKRLIVGEFLVV